MDVLSLNQRFVRELIDLYKMLPAVWKTKSPDYKCKNKKAKAYNLLVQKCREFVPDADREFVRHKINSLRTCFRKEWRKIQASKANVSHPDDVYRPSLWYFDLLTFTTEQEDSTIADGNYSDEQKVISNDNSVYVNENMNLFKKESVSEDDPLSTEVEIQTTPAFKRQKIECKSLPSPTSASLVPIEDVFDAIGKNIAHKLRGMDLQQRIIAEKIISDVMYYGQMETLTPGSHLSLHE